MVQNSRWIDLDGVVNMRDLGGLPTRRGSTIRPRTLIRSDNLQDLTDADISRLVGDLGVTDVIDLRTDVELATEGPSPLDDVRSITHHHFSLIPTRTENRPEVDVGVGTPWRDHPDAHRDAGFWATHYLRYIAERPDSISAALATLRDGTGASIVHCAAGKDRTGTIVAIALDVAEVPHEAIIDDYVLTAQRLEAIIARLLPRPIYGTALQTQTLADQLPRPESMERILAALGDGFGGAAGLLRSTGWSDDDVTALRTRLVR